MLYRRRWAGRVIAAAAVVFAVAAAALAGPPPRRFETVGLAEGLSNLSTTALALDRDGFVWIGTEEGLDRFDGLSMRVFRHRPGDPSSLASNRISALLVAADGTLWVGTRGGGLARYDPASESFERFRADPADTATTRTTRRASPTTALGPSWSTARAGCGWGR